MNLGFDIWQEIYSTIKRNKMRTFLTGFAVSWGIFMLIVLLGSGNGLIHAFEESSADMAKNSIKIFPGSTSKVYKGLETARHIQLGSKDIDLTQNRFKKNVVSVGATISKGGVTLSYKDQYVALDLVGVYPSYTEVERCKMENGSGRFVNQLDIAQRRKVIVLSRKTSDVLFRKESGIGKFIVASGVAYQVVGIYKDRGNMESRPAYIPFSTAQIIYNKADTINNITFTTKGLVTQEANLDFEKMYRKAMAGQHSFDPTDDNAIWIWNRFTNYLDQMKAMNILTIALWVIGIFTLLSGIVGVSNIMLITVKERTKEFGIKKALGASPSSILVQVVLEGIVITTLFGYIGLLLGVGATEYMNTFAGTQSVEAMNFTLFKDPTVDMSIAIQATITLIIAGTLAGFFPARRAVKIRPIEALRAE